MHPMHSPHSHTEGRSSADLQTSASLPESGRLWQPPFISTPGWSAEVAESVMEQGNQTQKSHPAHTPLTSHSHHLNTRTRTTTTPLMEANLRHLMRHEAKPNPKPQSDKSVTRGFEAVAYPKIVRELKSHDLEVKQKSLVASRELLGSSTSYVQCIAAGITPAVIALLTDPDAIVRERAAGTMQYIAIKEVGARDMVQHGGVPELVKLLEDAVPEVRDAAYDALIEAARFNSVRMDLVRLGRALPRLMQLVLQEEHSRSLQGLLLLNACVQVRNNTDALKQMVDVAAAVPSLGLLISEDRDELIQEQAAQLLGLVASTFPDAKLEAVQVGCVPKLLALLQQESNVLLASAAATALMMITIVNEGKYAVIECEGGLQALAGAWLDPLTSEPLCVNLTQCISNVTEAPEARPVLVECGAMARLAAIHSDTSNTEIVRRGAAEAMRQCKFRFLPHERLPGRTEESEFEAEAVAAA